MNAPALPVELGQSFKGDIIPCWYNMGHNKEWGWCPGGPQGDTNGSTEKELVQALFHHGNHEKFTHIHDLYIYYYYLREYT